MTELFVWLAGATLVATGLAIIRARRTKQGKSEMIRIVSSRYLGAKRYVTLVEVDGQRLLLGLGGDTVTLVARLEGEAAGGSPPRAASALPTFGRELNAARPRAARARGGLPPAAGDFPAGHDA